MAESDNDVTVVPSSRDVIERKLLTALSDGAQVAILATESDLELLIEALHVFGTRPSLKWARDLRRLRNESFGGFPS